MKKIELTKVEKALLSLLRASLQGEAVNNSSLESFTEKDWNLLYSLSKKQGVAALVWDGILTLPSELQPPRTIKIVWALYVEQCEKKYVHYVRVIAELTDFFAQHQIGTVLLKGVGLSSLYPHPNHREGGDLDIYTYSLDKMKFTDEEARLLSNKLIEKMGIQIANECPKHSVFTYKGITVENHNYFLNKDLLKSVRLLDSYLTQIISPHSITLLNGSVFVFVPSDNFNVIFVSYHAMQHLCSGLSLHHLCDWACLINHKNLNFLNKIDDKKYSNAVITFSQLTNEYLGTQVETERLSKEMNLILYDLLRNPYSGKFKKTGKMNMLFFKIKRFVYIKKLRKQIVGDRVFRDIWKLICHKIKVSHQ